MGTDGNRREQTGAEKNRQEQTGLDRNFKSKKKSIYLVMDRNRQEWTEQTGTDRNRQDYTSDIENYCK